MIKADIAVMIKYLSEGTDAHIYQVPIPSFRDNAFLEPVRDIFFFCCFSSLRYSDASSLRWNDVRDDHVEVTTVKTADSISIEINDMMRGISPNVVMKWTGHASYSSMKPYIDIVDSIKASEMAKMNFMD